VGLAGRETELIRRRSSQGSFPLLLEALEKEKNGGICSGDSEWKVGLNTAQSLVRVKAPG